jgi:hypothetical protein
MPKTEKKVYTFDQLDKILCRRGETDGYLCITRLRGSAWVTALASGGNLIRIKYSTDKAQFDIARVYRVHGGETVYAVLGCPEEIRKQPKYRQAYRAYVSRLTPLTLTSRSSLRYAATLVRVSDGEEVQAALPSVLTPVGPHNCSRLQPTCIVPSCVKWLESWRTSLPTFAARSRAFHSNLRRELGSGLPCEMQLLTREQGAKTGWRNFPPTQAGMYAHVCTPPTAHSIGRRLLIVTCPHSLESRRHFGVDGDYGLKHSQFAAFEADGKNLHIRWPCARDAIAGIKEWVLSTVYIPGPM